MTIHNLKCPACGHPYSYDVSVPPDDEGAIFVCANDNCSHIFKYKESDSE